MPMRERVQHAKAGDYMVGGQVVNSITEAVSGIGEELIWGKEGHYGYPHFDIGRDVGGAFLKHEYKWSRGSVDVHIIGGSAYNTHTYKGQWYSNALHPWSWPKWDDSYAYGPEAYSKMKPNKPNMSGLNAALELRELPRLLMQRFAERGLKDMASYHVALQFGWLPLLSDAIKLVNTQRQAQKLYKQLLRDEGRPVRRKITLRDDSYVHQTENYTLWNAEGGPSLNSYFFANWGNHPVVRKRGSSRRVWAAAQFKYHLPPGPRDIEWKRRQLEAIYGLYPSPAVVYNAIPWTWLIDYFTNLGHVVDNLSSTLEDRCAADYFYVMNQSTDWCTNDQTVHFYPVGKPGQIETHVVPSIHTRSTKLRLRGDPFGFGTPENSLSGVQLSILGALGLSRLR